MSFQPITQDYNDEQMALLSTHFWTRNEPNVAWRHAVSSVMALPALRAFWPMSSVDYTVASRARDVSGGGYHLSDNNTPLFGYDQLAPYAGFDGINQYLDRADGGAANWADITGAEAYVAPKAGGLTLGGWFYIDALTGVTQGLSGKWDSGGVNQRSYLLSYLNGGAPQFLISTNGAASQTVTAGAVALDTWFFAVGRFTPSAEIAVFVNDVKTTNVAGIVATIFDSTAPFGIGAFSTWSNWLAGRASMCWLCASALSDSIITALYHQQRKMYNV